MTRFWWVRHGPTHARAFAGWRDIPADLSDTPRLARLAAYLPEDALVASSDLLRATATADAIGGKRARLARSASLREFDFGNWDGRTFDEVAAKDPDLSRAFWETPGEVAPPGGESWNTVAARVGKWADRQSIAHAGSHIIVVAHFGVILTQVARARGATPVEALSQPIDPLSVTEIAFDGAWHLIRANHSP